MVTITPISGCRTTKIYCRAGECPAGRRTKPENKIYFRSREEARLAGYRACKICKPDGEGKMRETFFFTQYKSPLGTYLLASSKTGVACVKTEDRSEISFSRWEREGIEIKEDAEPNLELIDQLDAYFAGKRRDFSVPLDLRGTSFQRQVWDLLCDIPWGETRTYGEIAQALGRPRAARAVGRAVGTNPVSIVVPCHRIIGSDGSLTGYGGGLDRKTALLKLEASWGL